MLAFPVLFFGVAFLLRVHTIDSLTLWIGA
jgi:hypothetical protein